MKTMKISDAGSMQLAPFKKISERNLGVSEKSAKISQKDLLHGNLYTQEMRNNAIVLVTVTFTSRAFSGFVIQFGIRLKGRKWALSGSKNHHSNFVSCEITRSFTENNFYSKLRSSFSVIPTSVMAIEKSGELSSNSEFKSEYLTGDEFPVITLIIQAQKFPSDTNLKQ